MQPLSEIKSLLASHNLSPRKSLGQNFLIDHNLIRKLVDAADPRPGGLILEVGPGTGALTDELLVRGPTVIACELDRGLAALLRERLADPIASRQLTLIEGDCLGPGRMLSPVILAALADAPVNPDYKEGVRNGPAAAPTPPSRSGLTHTPSPSLTVSPSHPLPPFTLVANLPYSAATPLILSLLINHPESRALYVTIQREVADRILARPGSRDYGALGIVAQALSTPERLATLPPECFWPRPDITSTMLVLTRREEPLISNPRALLEFCQRLFASRRKQLGSTLKGEPGLQHGWPAGIEPSMRAEDLGVEQVVALCAAVALG